MAALMVSTVEESYAAVNAPSAPDIEAAMQNALTGTTARWIGPRARITRRGGVTDNFLHPLTPENVTSVAWAIDVPDNAQAQTVIAQIRTNLDARLHALSSDFAPVRITAFAVAVNGPVAWWQSGEASVTRTRDEFPALTTDANENPVGPDAGTHPTTPGEILTGGAGTGADFLTPLAWCVGLGTLVYFGAPLVEMFRASQRGSRRAP